MFSQGLGCHSLCPHCESESTSASLGGPPVRRKAGLSSLYPGIALQSPHSNSQCPCTPVDMCPSLGYGVQGHGVDWLCVSHSTQTVTDQRVHSLIASNAPLLSQPVSLDVGVSPSLQLPCPWVLVLPCLVLLPSSLHPCQIMHGPTQSFLAVEDSCWYSVSVL